MLAQWHEDALRLAPDLRGLRVLEVGCGAGEFALALAARGAAHVDAVDFSSAAVGIAAGKAEGSGLPVVFRVADAQRLPFEDGSYDVVFSCECLEHVPEPAVALGEMARVTRAGGGLVLTTENYTNAMLLAWAVSWWRGVPFDSGAGAQPIEHFFVYWKVRRLVRRAGYRVQRMIGAHHVFLLLPRFDPGTFVKERFASPRLARFFLPMARHVSFLAIREVGGHR